MGHQKPTEIIRQRNATLLPIRQRFGQYLLGLDVRPTFAAEEGAAKPPPVKF